MFKRLLSLWGCLRTLSVFTGSSSPPAAHLLERRVGIVVMNVVLAALPPGFESCLSYYLLAVCPWETAPQFPPQWKNNVYLIWSIWVPIGAVALLINSEQVHPPLAGKIWGKMLLAGLGRQFHGITVTSGDLGSCSSHHCGWGQPSELKC